METIKNAIWGSGSNQSGSEPLSGQTGTGEGSEPYDTGNASGQSGTTGETHVQTSEGGTTSGPTHTAGEPSGFSNDVGTADSSSGPLPSKSGQTNEPMNTTNETTTPINTSSGPLPSSSSHIAADTTTPESLGLPSATEPANSAGTVRPEESIDKSGVSESSANEPSIETRGADRGPVGGVGAVEPSVNAQPESGSAPKQKHQGADRPGEEPSEQQTEAIKDKKNVAEDAMKGDDTAGDDSSEVKKDPNDHSGEPLGSVNHGIEEKKDDDKSGENEDKGTGEIWIKSTGVAADGGDFDATKPGAAKEADRLLEEKGIHHEPGAGPPAAEPGQPDPLDPASKKGLGSKLKEKLHIGSKKDKDSS